MIFKSGYPKNIGWLPALGNRKQRSKHWKYGVFIFGYRITGLPAENHIYMHQKIKNFCEGINKDLFFFNPSKGKIVGNLVNG